MNISRSRRYARLMSLAKKPDSAMELYLWWAAGQGDDVYLHALRLLEQEGLRTTKTVVNLQVNSKELLHDPN